MNDDELIRQFMKSNCQEVADNGFTKRVMRRIPRRHRLWVICLEVFVAVAAFCLLMMSLDGYKVMCDVLVAAIQLITYLKHLSFNPLYIVILLGLCTWLASHRLKALI